MREKIGRISGGGRSPRHDAAVDRHRHRHRATATIFFTGSLLIEVIFSLDGMGLLGYDAVIKRDYPILFGTMFVLTLIALFMQLVGDLAYVLVDPRIDFETRG